MKVLLIQSHLGRTEPHPPLYPLGLVYLASALSKHEVQIIDLNIWELNLAYENLKKKIIDFNPDVAGVSIRNIDTTNRRDIFIYFKTVRPTAQIIKEASPNIKLLAGGPGFSMFAEKIMSRIREIDFGCYLEGEESVPELLDQMESPESVKGIYFRKNGRVQFTGYRELPDFSKLPMPRRDLEIIDNKPYVPGNKLLRGYNIGIQTKRGCVQNCAYCNYPFLSGNRLRVRSPKDVVDEIEYMLTIGMRQFCFVDNIFNIPQSHAKEICKEILRRKLDVKWNAWFEIKNTTPELMHLAYEAGCRKAGFSPDAATNKTLVALQKGITEADVRENMELIRTFPEIEVGYGIFFDIPGITLREYLKTLVTFVRMGLKFYGQGGVGLGWVRIYPNTALYRQAIKDGILLADTELLPESEKDLAKLFYVQPPYRFLNACVIFSLNFLDSVVKPSVKFVLKTLLKKGKNKTIWPLDR